MSFQIKKYKNVFWPNVCPNCKQTAEFNPRHTKRICLYCLKSARFKYHEQKIIWEDLIPDDMREPLNNIDELLDFGDLTSLLETDERKVEEQKIKDEDRQLETAGID